LIPEKRPETPFAPSSFGRESLGNFPKWLQMPEIMPQTPFLLISRSNMASLKPLNLAALICHVTRLKHFKYIFRSHKKEHLANKGILDLLVL
jgi:hypothetical protein